MTMHEVIEHHQHLKAVIDSMPKGHINRAILVRSYNAILALRKANNKLWDEIVENEGSY